MKRKAITQMHKTTNKQAMTIPAIKLDAAPPCVVVETGVVCPGGVVVGVRPLSLINELVENRSGFVSEIFTLFTDFTFENAWLRPDVTESRVS